MRFFIAGIIQGSYQEEKIHDQDYRSALTQLLQENFPNADVFDPFAKHHDSIHYPDDLGREVFLQHNALCSEVDVVIAFVPEASMGTAIEMWEAWRNGRTVVAVSPMAVNWAIKFLSHILYPTFETLVKDIKSGELKRKIEAQ